MKTFLILIGIIVAITVANATYGEVKIKKVPLTRQQAALTDGEELYLELCAVCHGESGKGDGPAASALVKALPDLTGLATRNNGKFPRQKVEDSITGESRIVSHGTINMPIWGQAFEGVRPDWKMFRREALARQRIHSLAEYLATIQTE